MSNSEEPLTYKGQELIEREEALVKERAMELAKSVGREMWNKSDLDRALEEVLGNPQELPAPETLEDENVEAITSWDEPVTSAGHEAPRVHLENEDNLSEVLILEGVEEADHALRIASIDDEDEEDRAIEESLEK